jgi:hypothetical protein
VPPSDAADLPTLLTGGDPNFTRVSGGDDPGALYNAMRAMPSPPPAAGNLAGRDSTRMYLKFDGQTLSLHDGGDVVAQWKGVSGRENFGGGEDQEKAKYGPMPEGTYDIKQSRYQTISARNAVYGIAGRGEWPGSLYSWGSERVWADPTKETVDNGLTFGRKDMAIHGGWEPGSAGCIDLTDNMSSFAKTFRSLGSNLKLYVDYSKTTP